MKRSYILNFVFKDGEEDSLRTEAFHVLNALELARDTFDLGNVISVEIAEVEHEPLEDK